MLNLIWGFRPPTAVATLDKPVGGVSVVGGGGAVAATLRSHRSAKAEQYTLVLCSDIESGPE